MAQHHHRPAARRYQVRSWDGETLRARKHSSLPGFLFCLSPVPSFAKPTSSKSSSLYLNSAGTQRNGNGGSSPASSRPSPVSPSFSEPHHRSRHPMALQHHAAAPQDTVASFRGIAQRFDAVLPGAIKYYTELENQFLREIAPLQLYATKTSLGHAWREKVAYADRNIGEDFLKSKAGEQGYGNNTNAPATYANLQTFGGLRIFVSGHCIDLCDLILPGDQEQHGFQPAHQLRQDCFKVMTPKQRESARWLQKSLRDIRPSLCQDLNGIEGDRNLLQQVILHLEMIKKALGNYSDGWKTGNERAGGNVGGEHEQGGGFQQNDGYGQQ